MSKNSDLIFRGQQHKFTAPFGEWRDNHTRQHMGTDYGTYGKKLTQYCPADGGVVHNTVTTEANGNARGLYADIRWEKYGIILQHADSVCVKKGQKLKEGDPITTTGITGKDRGGKRVSTGIHAHIEVYEIATGKRVDFEGFDVEGLGLSYEKWKEYMKRYEKEEAAKGVQDAAKDAWVRAVKKGIFVDGMAPRSNMTREVTAIILDRLGLLK